MGDVWAYQGVYGDGRFNGTMQNVVGPTLVAVATKFGLGAEIQSPTGLFFFFCFFLLFDFGNPNALLIRNRL